MFITIKEHLKRYHAGFYLSERDLVVDTWKTDDSRELMSFLEYRHEDFKEKNRTRPITFETCKWEIFALLW